jgi:hypothetical protein
MGEYVEYQLGLKFELNKLALGTYFVDMTGVSGLRAVLIQLIYR